MTTSELEDDTLRIETVECGPHELVVALKDGRRVVAPLWWLPRLQNATPEQRSRWEIMPFGDAIEWPDIDEHVSVKGLLRGRPSRDAVPPTGGEQQIELEGHGNIAVQTAGDHNTIVIGAHRLTLTRHEAWADDQSDIGLLTPFTRAIPLIGRETELADLQAWLGSDRPTSVRVLTGGAGVGKTRLALELIHRIRKEWQAGFVRRTELTRIGHGDAPIPAPKPVLAIVDYAAAHAEALNAWLEELADPPAGANQPKFRLLLLERRAEPGTGWWETAFGLGGAGARAIRRLLDPEQPVALRPLASTGDRRAVFQAMLARKDHLAAPPDDPAFERRLEDVGLGWGGDPLFLMMAGLKAAETGLPGLLALSRTDLAIELAEREVARIKRIAKARGVHERLLAVLAGYVTLCRGLPPEALTPVIETEKSALALSSAGNAGDIVLILAEALPGEGGRIGPILPDIIGEAVTLLTFRAYPDRGAEAVRRAFQINAPNVAAAVVHTIQDYNPDEFAEALAWFDALATATTTELDQLMLLADALPITSLALAERAAAVTEAVAERLRALAQKAPDAYTPDLAGSLNNLAIHLSEVGRRQDALEPAAEAVSIRRALAQKAPDAYTPDLAVSLMMLANCLEANDDLAAALDRNREAIELYRPFFVTHPQAFAHRMMPMCQQYVERCGKLAVEPDAALLQPIVQVLMRMQNEQSESQPDGGSS